MKNHTKIDPDWEKAFELDQEDLMTDEELKAELEALEALDSEDPKPAPKPKRKSIFPPDFNRLANAWFWGFLVGITMASLLLK